MAYKLPGANLTNYNSQLVEHLEDLKKQSEDLHEKIVKAQDHKQRLEQKACDLTEELGALNRKI